MAASKFPLFPLLTSLLVKSWKLAQEVGGQHGRNTTGHHLYFGKVNETRMSKEKKTKRAAQDFSCFKLVNPQRKSLIILKSMKMVRTVK